MSEDNHSVSLDMLVSQLQTVEHTVSEALAKRRQISSRLGEILSNSADPIATSILASLDRLVYFSRQEDTAALRIWASAFPDDMAERGLEKVIVSGSEPLRIWDHARAIFGHRVHMLFDNDPREVLTQCIEHNNCVGVLGWMTLAGSGQWWPVLNESRYHDLSIIGAWPVTGNETPYAAIIAKGPISAEAGSSTIFIAHDDHHKVDKIFGEMELTVREFGRARSLVLFETTERLKADDPRIKAARASGLDGLRIVGALPRYTQPGD